MVKWLSDVKMATLTPGDVKQYFTISKIAGDVNSNLTV